MQRHVAGGYIVADIGIGEIDKLILVHQGDTHAQDVKNYGMTVDAKAIGEVMTGNLGAAAAKA